MTETVILGNLIKSLSSKMGYGAGEGAYDIFTPVISRYDSRIIGVPEYVDQVASMTNAPYIFLYTIV